ncbi:MAG: hypothetical protein R2830_20540 [Saprospiraceae bacterium]
MERQKSNLPVSILGKPRHPFQAGLIGSEISTHNFSCGDTNRRFNQPIYRFWAVKRLKPLPDARLSKAQQLKLWVNKAEPISPAFQDKKGFF